MARNKAQKVSDPKVDRKLISRLAAIAKKGGSANIEFGRALVEDETGATDTAIARDLVAANPHLRGYSKGAVSKRRTVYATVIGEWKWSESDAAKIAATQFDSLYQVVAGIASGKIEVKPETVRKIGLGKQGKERLSRLLPKSESKADKVALDSDTRAMLTEEKKERGLNSWEEAIQALKTENESLKRRNAELEEENSALRDRLHYSQPNKPRARQAQQANA